MKIKIFLLYVLATHFQTDSMHLVEETAERTNLLPENAGTCAKSLMVWSMLVLECIYAFSNIGYVISVFGLNNVQSDLPLCDNNMYSTLIVIPGSQCPLDRSCPASSCPACPTGTCTTGNTCLPSNYINPSTCPTGTCTTGNTCLPNNYINPSTCPTSCPLDGSCPASSCPTCPTNYEVVSQIINPPIGCYTMNPGSFIDINGTMGCPTEMIFSPACPDLSALQRLQFPYLYCPPTDISSGNIPSCSVCSLTFSGSNQQLPCNQITASSTLYCPTSTSAYSNCSFNPAVGGVTYQVCPSSGAGLPPTLPTSLCCQTGATCGNTYPYICAISNNNECPYPGFIQLKCCNVPKNVNYLDDDTNAGQYCCSGSNCDVESCLPSNIFSNGCPGNYSQQLQCCDSAIIIPVNGPFATPSASNNGVKSANISANHSLNAVGSSQTIITPCQENSFYSNFYTSIYSVFFLMPMIFMNIYTYCSSKKSDSSHNRNIQGIKILLNTAIAAINLSSFITLISNGRNNIVTFWYFSTSVLTNNASWVTAIEVLSMINTVIAVFFIIMNLIGLCKAAS